MTLGSSAQVIQTPDPACSFTKLLSACLEVELCLMIQSPYHILNGWRKKLLKMFRREISHPILCSFPSISDISVHVYLYIHSFLWRV